MNLSVMGILLSFVTLINEPQSFESQKLVHLFYAFQTRGNQGAQSSRGNNLGVRTYLFFHAPDNLIHQSHITKDNSRLHGMNGVLPYDLLGLGQLHPRKLRSAHEERFTGDAQARSDRSTHVFSFRRNIIKSGGGPEIHYD